MNKITLIPLLLLTLCMAMTSCHDSTEIKLTYKIELSEDLIDIGYVEVTFTDFNGNAHKEMIEDGRWEKSFTTSYPPVSSKIRVEVSRNAHSYSKEEAVLDLDFTAYAERYVGGEIMDSVAYTEYFDSTVRNDDELVSALKKFDFERDYVITSASDSSVLMEQFKIDRQ